MTSAPAAAGSRGAAVSAPAVVGGFGGNVFPAESVGMMAGMSRTRESSDPLTLLGAPWGSLPSSSLLHDAPQQPIAPSSQ